MVNTQQKIRAQKRKNMAGIIALCIPVLFAIVLLIGSISMILGVRVTNVNEISALDISENDIYYFEEMHMVDVLPSLSSYRTMEKFLVYFEDGDGQRYYTSISLDYGDEIYHSGITSIMLSQNDITVSGCFHSYDIMGDYTSSTLSSTYEKHNGQNPGELLDATFYYDAKDPAAYRDNEVGENLPMTIGGLVLLIPSLVGIILLVNKRKKIGVVQTRPEVPANIIVERYFQKYRATQVWKYIVWGVLLASILLLILAINGVVPMGFIVAFSMSVFVVILFHCIAHPLFQGKKLLDAESLTPELLVADLVHADSVSEDFRCGNRVVLIKGQILPLRTIRWVYLYRQFYMGITTQRSIILRTINGKSISIEVNSDDEEFFKDLLARNRDKFHPDLIIGYNALAKKRYKALRKAYKAQAKNLD